MTTQENPLWPSPRSAWTFVALLFAAYVVAFIDRTILSLLIEPIKADLALTDVQIGLISGVAFGVFYSVMGLPLGYLVDVVSRRTLLAICVAIWSLATAYSGLVHSFSALFATRILVGIGEAALAPAALSLISDLFPPARRSLAVAVFVMAGSIGGGLALCLGGGLLSWLNALDSFTLPGLGALSPWRACFILVGLPGLVLAAVFLLFSEPKRQVMSAAAGDVGSSPADRGGLWRFLRSGGSSFIPLTAAMTLLGTYAYGLLTWAPTHFIRHFGWSAPDIGMALGLMLLFAGASGAVLGGKFAQYLRNKGRGNANTTVVALGLGALVIFGSSATVMPSPTATVLMLVPVLFLTAFPSGAAAAAIQDFSPVQLRGRVTAIYYIVMNLIGISLGAPLVAYISTHVFAGGLGPSMALVGGVLLPCAALLAWRARKSGG